VGILMAFNEDKDYEISQVINNFKGIDKLEEQIKFVLLYIYQLEAAKQELFHAEILKYEELLLNHDFFRRVKRRDALVEKHPGEYFGKDYDYDDPFLYDSEIETQISNISLQLINLLGLVLKAMKENNFMLDDEM